MPPSSQRFWTTTSIEHTWTSIVEQSGLSQPGVFHICQTASPTVLSVRNVGDPVHLEKIWGRVSLQREKMGRSWREKQKEEVEGRQVCLVNGSPTQLSLHPYHPIPHRSFGVVLWELLTGEIPYKDVDSSAIIWGVGSNSLHLPVPTSCPDGFKILLRQCW